MIKIKEIIDDVDHNLGIAIITIAFVYLLIVTLRNKRTLVPKYFYLLYGIGGLLIMNEMTTQQKPTVIIMELIGAFIALFLFSYSFYVK